MRKPLRPAWLSPLMIALVLPATGAFAETFRVATYNVENYLDQPTETRHYAKSEAAKAQVRANLKALKPDIVALEEIGQLSALPIRPGLQQRQQAEQPGRSLKHPWTPRIRSSSRTVRVRKGF